MFTVTAWKSGRDNSRPTLGLRVSPEDRDRHFRREWRAVRLRLPDGQAVDITLTASFWRSCPELRHPRIGRWLRQTGAFPWPHGAPPQYRVRPDRRAAFAVRGPA